MKKVIRLAAVCLLALPLLASCGSKEDKLQVAYEQYTLDNGLKVVLHQDVSDPIVSVAIQFHVGSAREKPGKTGFAHFFEHMLFQRSENLPRNAFFQKISAMGGDFNGGTGPDGTVYYETVPRDALEKILWMESDRMGFFINTVTQDGLNREIDVILNEKRQTADNTAYGQFGAIMGEELYPAGHPYSWAVIGKMDDIRSATIDDVKEFYATYYIPNNATLCIAGDFDLENTKELVQKYFGEIKPGTPVEKPKAWIPVLEETKRVVYEDPFAPLPLFAMLYPVVEEYHPDAAPLEILAQLLSESKKSPLYRAIVETNLAPEANAFGYSQEISGLFGLELQAYPGIGIDTLYAAIEEAFRIFETEGVDATELQMIKAMAERNSYNSLSSVRGKAINFARNTEFGGRPDRFIDELEAKKAVTAEDIMRVYNTYVKGKNFLAISLVPQGQAHLALANSRPATVEVENVDDASSQQTASKAGALVDDDYEHSPSAFDRSIEPPYMSNTPTVTVPAIWDGEMANGMKLMGITHNEIPLVNFRIAINGGALLDPQGKDGVAYLNAALMNEGTALRTAEEIEQALNLLGASVRVACSNGQTTLYGSCLSRNFAPVMAIVEEMLLHPRFDEEALVREKNRIESLIQNDAKEPTAIARRAARSLRYGKDSFYARATYGTMESVENITMEDIKAYNQANLTPKNAAFLVAGHITKEVCESALATLVADWNKDAVAVAWPEFTPQGNEGKLFFVDYPGAKQAVIVVLGNGMKLSDPNHAALDVLNFKLGSGSNGELFNVLRLQRGYTYGAYSYFSPATYDGQFGASSSVQSSVTKESVALFKEIIGGFGAAFNQELLDLSKDALLRKNAFAFETQYSLLYMLDEIYANNLPYNYVKLDEDVMRNATVEQIKDLAAQYLDAKNHIYIVVADAKTQLKNLKGAKLYK